MENFPYTDDMLADKVKPYACQLWNWSRKQSAANLIQTTEKQIALTLLPRTQGTFSCYGLRVHKMRYHCDEFTEKYLDGGVCELFSVKLIFL